MVLIIEEQGEGSKVRENGVPPGIGPDGTDFRTNNMAMDKPVLSLTTVDEDNHDEPCEDNDEPFEADYTRNYWEDEDDIYQEFEELDFESLPDHSDTRSISSDDSFYPPDSDDFRTHMFRPPSPESPEPISFFKACCNNNSIIVKIMIRQGVTEEEVRETDRNRRVGVGFLFLFIECLIFFICCHRNLQRWRFAPELFQSFQSFYWKPKCAF